MATFEALSALPLFPPPPLRYPLRKAAQKVVEVVVHGRQSGTPFTGRLPVGLGFRRQDRKSAGEWRGTLTDMHNHLNKAFWLPV